MALNSSGNINNSSYLKFKLGKINSPNTTIYTSNSTFVSPQNFSYNYNTVEAGSQVSDFKKIKHIKKESKSLKDQLKDEKKSKMKNLNNLHREFLFEKLKKNANLEGFFMTEGLRDNEKIRNVDIINIKNDAQAYEEENFHAENKLEVKSSINFFKKHSSSGITFAKNEKQKIQSTNSLDLNNNVFTPKKYSSSNKLNQVKIYSPDVISLVNNLQEKQDKLENNNSTVKFFSSLGGHYKRLSAPITAKDLGSINTRETLPEFMSKITEIRRGQLISEIQKERANRIEEKYDNRLEEIKDSMKNMKNSQNLLNEWDNNFVTYVRHLKFQRDVEKIENEKLLQIRVKLDQENKQARNKIIKSQNDMEAFVERRNFLICVKERKKSLPVHFFEKLHHLEEESIRKSGIMPTHFSSIFANANFNKKKGTSFNVGLSTKAKLDKGELNELDRLINYVTTNKIFSSVKEFNETMEFLEKENMRLLNNLNKNNQYIVELKVENEKLSKNLAHTEDKFSVEISNKEKILNDLKNKSKNLKEELEKLNYEQLSEQGIIKTSEGTSRTSKTNKRLSLGNSEYNLSHSNFMTSQTNFGNKKTSVCLDWDEVSSTNMIYSKLKEIFNLLKQKLHFLNLNDNVSLTLGTPDLELTRMKIIIVLQNIEKGLNFLLEKYKQYKNEENLHKTKTIQNFNTISINSEKLPLSVIEWNLEKERKAKKTNDQKMKIDGDRQMQKDEVLERANKIVIVPKRKAIERFKPRDNDRKNTEKCSDENAKFEDFINYDD
jgi:hypothetical protein